LARKASAYEVAGSNGSTVFTAAIDALFADPHLVRDAVFRAGGADLGIPLRVIRRRPDRVGEFGDARIVAGTTVFDVRVSDIGQPAAGDTIELDGAVYRIQGAPLRDAGRLVWSIEAQPA